MNGNKVTIDISTTDQTEDVMDAAMTKIGLADKFYYYFALFLVRKEDIGGGIRSKEFFFCLKNNIVECLGYGCVQNIS